MCRQINPSGAVQRWKIDSIDPGNRLDEPLAELSYHMTDSFSDVIEKAVKLSKKLTIDEILPGEKDC